MKMTMTTGMKHPKESEPELGTVLLWYALLVAVSLSSSIPAVLSCCHCKHREVSHALEASKLHNHGFGIAIWRVILYRLAQLVLSRTCTILWIPKYTVTAH